MSMPFTAADLDKILAQQQQKEPAEEAFSHPIEVGKTAPQALFLSTANARRRDWLFYLLGVLFLIGIGMGALLVGNCQPQTAELLQHLLGDYAQLRQQHSFGSIALSTFGSLFLLLLTLFLLGFCSIAQPAILLVPLFKGLGYGFAAGSLYQEYGAAAILQIAVLLLPSMLPGALLLMLAGKSAFRFSSRLFYSSVRREQTAGAPSAKRYCIRFALFAVLCLAVALLDAGICVKFRGLLL